MKYQPVIEFPHKIYLTFDVEDFINDRSLGALRHILELLKKFDQKALFFITGHMAEKLARFPQLVEMLEEHEIGFHSTSHSVHPNIFEYTDIESYQEAYRISLSREVSHINPLSGAIEGSGGIALLKDLFYDKRIEAFRAPGFSWSPPHLEALAHLGIKCDFSTNISDTPVIYRDITFFPFPSFVDSPPLGDFSRSVLKRKVTVLDFHPSFFTNEDWWDSIFFSKTNPKIMSGVTPRTATRVKTMFHRFVMLLKLIDVLRKMKIIEPCNRIEESETELDLKQVDMTTVYHMIVTWPMKRFNYKQKFIRSHLSHFFEPSATG